MRKTDVREEKHDRHAMSRLAVNAVGGAQPLCSATCTARYELDA